LLWSAGSAADFFDVSFGSWESFGSFGIASSPPHSDRHDPHSILRRSVLGSFDPDPATRLALYDSHARGLRATV